MGRLIVTWLLAAFALVGIIDATDGYSPHYTAVAIFTAIGAGPWFLLLRGLYRWLSGSKPAPPPQVG